MNFVNKLFACIKPQSLIPHNEREYQLYKYWRVRTFLALHIGYCIFYLTRKNLTPAIHIFSEQLDIDIIRLGTITGIFSMVYGAGKILSGVISDKFSARIFIAVGLLLSGIINLFYGFLDSFYTLAFFWGLNGLFQSTGYPPIAKTLVNWFSPSESAKVWSWWNSSHTIGTFLAGGLIALILRYLSDWRAIFYIPGIIAIISSVFIFLSLRDSPQSVNLPPINVYKKEKVLCAEKKIKSNQWFGIKEYIICNPYIWCFCLVLCFMQMCRFGILDWATKFLYEEKGVDKVSAVWLWNIAPLLGMFGGLTGGYIVSHIFKGRCGWVILGYLLLLSLSIYGYIHLSSNIHLHLTCFLLGAINFFIDGAIILVNVMMIRSTTREVVGSVAGFGGGISYILGTALGANFLAVYIIHNHGWNYWYYMCIACIIVSMLLIAVCMKKEYSKNRC